LVEVGVEVGVEVVAVVGVDVGVGVGVGVEVGVEVVAVVEVGVEVEVEVEVGVEVVVEVGVEVVLTLERLAIQLNKVTALRVKPTISTKAMLQFHAKLAKLDHGIFVKACDNLSNESGFLDLKEIYAAYYKAKLEVRESNPDWKGCKYCNDGYVHYERHKKGYKGPITYHEVQNIINVPFNMEMHLAKKVQYGPLAFK